MHIAQHYPLSLEGPMSRTCLLVLNVVHQYPIHCHYPLLLSNKLSLSIIIIQYIVIIHYCYPIRCHYPLSYNTLSLSIIIIQYIICVPGARPTRTIACVHPSFPSCRHRHEYTEVNKYKIYPDRKVKQILHLSDNLRNSLLLITFCTLWALTCLAMEPSQLLTNIVFGNINV